jgi:hypothetical protein
MVTDLLIKFAHKRPLTSVKQLSFSTKGITGNVPTSPLRQVLILPKHVSNEFQLQPGDLKENLIIHYPELHDLPSGTVLQIGEAQIRLTFHCEPCSQVKDKVCLKAIQHKRGYLGLFLNEGVLNIGDKIENLGGLYEPIPYRAKDRVHAYLLTRTKPISATELLFECGLPLLYARAIPAMIRHLPEDLKTKVIFKSHSRQERSRTDSQLLLQPTK